MKPTVTVVTPTRDRPESLALCKMWIKAQTYPVHEHRCPEGRGKYENLLAGFEGIETDIVVTTDDDDHFDPSWVERGVDGLEGCELFGMRLRRLYHLRARAYTLGTRVGPLDGSMAFRATLLPKIVGLLKRGAPMKEIWSDGGVTRIITDDQLVTEIRGVYPTGLSVKHDYTKGRFPELDPDGEVLRSWIGDGPADLYFDAQDEIDRRLSGDLR